MSDDLIVTVQDHGPKVVRYSRRAENPSTPERPRVTDAETYRRLFVPAPAHALRGEASVSYLYYPVAPESIRRELPDTKLICLLRNPVDRAFSAYNFLRTRDFEPLDSFEAALAAEPDRRQLDPVGRDMRFGSDTDLVQTGLRLGYGKGVFPSLTLTHLIPPRRCERDFLARALEAHGFSATLHGWIDTGEVAKPRTDLRFHLGELWRRLRRNPDQRLIARMHRRGQWRAYHTLRGTKPPRTKP